jgi:hypothetical protein
MCRCNKLSPRPEPFLPSRRCGMIRQWRWWECRRAGDTVSLRAPRRKGVAAAFGCVISALVVCLLQAMDRLGDRLASSAVIFLVVLGGMMLSEAVPSILELSLDQDGFVARQPGTRRRYRWCDIPSQFNVVPGTAGPRISFIWCPSTKAVREFIHPADLPMPPGRIAALLNERWQRARLDIRSCDGSDAMPAARTADEGDSRPRGA